MERIAPPTQAELEQTFKLKYGEPGQAGWSPALRWSFGHFNPDDYYETLVSRLVKPGMKWIDVGCGRDLFPSNRKLARILADRCQLLVGVDPDITLEENPFVHKKIHCNMDDFNADQLYDLVTLRMVAEHVVDPAALARSLSRCVRPGGRVVIYTVYKYSPVPLITNCVPFILHNPFKYFLWRTEQKDTFPTQFRLNTKGKLKSVMASGGFEENLFLYLDDCRTFTAFRVLATLELLLQRFLKTIGLHYPEVCLLGSYQKI